VTGVLGGLGAGNIGAAAGGMAPYIANKIKQATSKVVDGQEQTNVLANTMAHAVAGAVLAQLAGNNATAGAAGGELMARAILNSMYPGKQASDLTQDEKQVVSALGQLAAQLSAGVASGSVEGGIQGAVAGKNAVENNTLGSDDDDDDEFQLEHGNRPVKIISFTPKRIGVVDDDGDVKGMGGIISGGVAKAVNAAKEPVRFIEGVTVKDIKSGQTFTETVDLKPTLDRIASGGTNPHKMMVQYSEINLIARQEYLACPRNLIDTIKNMFIQLRTYQDQGLYELLLDKMVRLIIQMIIIKRSYKSGDYVMSVFKYEDKSVCYGKGAVFLARIDPNISDTDELLRSLYYLLWFPGYFGFNWNALYDCLRDLDWISENKVMIVHESLPGIPDSDLRIYLEVLKDCILDWVNDEKHQLEVYFNEKDQGEIERLLPSSNIIN